MINSSKDFVFTLMRNYRYKMPRKMETTSFVMHDESIDRIRIKIKSTSFGDANFEAYFTNQNI